jgi:hypothetical protein
MISSFQTVGHPFHAAYRCEESYREMKRRIVRMGLTSLIAKPVRWLIDKAGYTLMHPNAFEYDPFRDIQLLNERWNSSVQTFFDVGAHVGETSLKAVKQFPEARIFAFDRSFWLSGSRGYLGVGCDTLHARSKYLANFNLLVET